MQRGQACAQMGKADLALEALSDATRFSRGNSKAISQRGYVLARTGRVNEARQVLTVLDTVARERYVPPHANGRPRARERVSGALALRDEARLRGEDCLRAGTTDRPLAAYCRTLRLELVHSTLS
jgi:hypothetical protein